MVDELPPLPPPDEIPQRPPEPPGEPFLRRQAEWRRAQNGASGQRFSMR